MGFRCQVVLTDADESDVVDAALVVPGKEMDVAVLGTGEGGVALPKAFPNADFIATQAKDPDCLRYMQLVSKPRAQWPPHLAAAPLQFLYVAGVLCVQIDDVVRLGPRLDDKKTGRQSRRRRIRPFLGRPRIVLPADFRQRAIHAHHLRYYGGHFELVKTFARLALRYWWPRQRANVRAFRCTLCMANTQFSRPWRWLSLPIGTLFEIVAADIFGPLKPTARGYTHILVLIDHHARWVEPIALPEPTAELVAEAIFERWISRWGTMKVSLTDNGRRVTARLLQQLTDVYGMKRIYSSPSNPRGTSAVKSYMRTLKTTLKLCTQAFRTDWDVALQATALAYRATPHNVTGHTPIFLLTGQEVVLPLSREWHEPALCPLGVTWLEALWKCRVEVKKAHELAADENARAQTSETSRLCPGNHVALRLTKAERQADGRFSPLFKGPQPVPPQISRGEPPACTTPEAPTATRGRGGGTHADVSTQPVSHVPRRLRPKELRSRSRVSGSVPKLQLFSSPESRLRIESDTGDVVPFFFSWAQRGLSRSATRRGVSAATRAADTRRSQLEPRRDQVRRDGVTRSRQGPWLAHAHYGARHCS